MRYLARSRKPPCPQWTHHRLLPRADFRWLPTPKNYQTCRGWLIVSLSYDYKCCYGSLLSPACRFSAGSFRTVLLMTFLKCSKLKLCPPQWFLCHKLWLIPLFVSPEAQYILSWPWPPAGFSAALASLPGFLAHWHLGLAWPRIGPQAPSTRSHARLGRISFFLAFVAAGLPSCI